MPALAHSRLTRATQAGATSVLVHDALGRMVAQFGPHGWVNSAYDAAGRRTAMSWPDAFLIRFDHLVTGEVKAIREDGATTGAGVLATFGYDDLGRRTSLTRGNGTTTAYAYDAASRLASLSHDVAGGGNDLSLGFAYNPASQIEQATRSNDVYAYIGHQAGYEARATGGLNQLLSVAGAAATHDARGNLTGEGGRTFAYSAENMLTSATIGGVTTSLSYDPLLRLSRVAKGGAETGFQYEGLDLIAEYDASGAMTRRYVHGPGTDEPLVWYVGPGTDQRNWLHADERGSIVAVTSVTGALIQANSYDEYGVSGTANIGRFRYTGQAWLPEIGIQYSKARMYDPGLGRFLQPDPIGYDDGPNLYAYVGGDPVNFTDPLGLQTCPTGEPDEVEGCVQQDGTDQPAEIFVNGRRPQEIVVTATRLPNQGRPQPNVVGGPAPSGGSNEPGGGGETQKDECANRNSSGECVYVRDDKGKLQLDPDYAKKACQNYKAMMQSNKEVAAAAGATNLPGLANTITGGSLGFLGRVAKFFSAPGFVFLRGVTYLTAGALSFGSSPPPGCK